MSTPMQRVAACRGAGPCGTAATAFISELKRRVSELVFYAGISSCTLAPALMGMFWGAPLVAREFETGTLPAGLESERKPRSWVVAKLGLIGLAAMATAGLLSLITGWWASPILQGGRLGQARISLSIDRLAPPLFGAKGIVPIGYAAFAFALGVRPACSSSGLSPPWPSRWSGRPGPDRVAELGPPAPGLAAAPVLPHYRGEFE